MTEVWLLFALTFLVMAVAALGLGAGVLLGRAPLRRGCGGQGDGEACALCSRAACRARRPER